MTTTMEVNLTESTYESLHDIGTLYHDEIGGVWKYVKVIFGIYDEGDAVVHQWIPWNGMAKLEAMKTK